MFEGFRLNNIDVGDLALRVRHGGQGPAVLLLHGHPRTHATWHRVAQSLVREGFSVVCPDLRGYGQSGKPASTPDHAVYSKRAMAGDCRALMRSLGHDRFAVVGHDRGAYVAQRLAADHPEAVTHLAVLDAVPIAEALDRADAKFAQMWWHWFFLGQTAQPAEDVITLDWYRFTPDHMGAEAYADLREALSDPATVHAMCEDYRAGLGVDREADEADRAAGRRIACPTLVVWATRDDMEELYGDPVEIWREWAVDPCGARIDSGHHMAEEAPEELVAALLRLLRKAGGPPRRGEDDSGAA
jgi:haloacetate dehalogenase